MNATDTFYFDTSALLPYYREEAASPQINTFLNTLGPPVLISDLTRVEFFSAIARWVRMRELDAVQAKLLEEAFLGDVRSGLLVSRFLAPVHFRQAERWLRSRRTTVRTLDSLHLACSRQFAAELVTCDAVLHAAALLFRVPSRLIEPPPPMAPVHGG